MAYLDVGALIAASASPFPAPPFPALAPDMAEPASFGRREWQVIELARHDGLASLREPGRLARAIGWLVGGGANLRLADPRLEALRQLAVLGWHLGYAVPASAIAVFRESGFSVQHLELLLARIAAGRLARRRRAAA